MKKKKACKTLWILTGAFLYLFFFFCQDLIILGLFYVTIIMLKPLEWRSTLICSIPVSGIAAPVWLMWTVCVSVQTGIFTATMLLVFNSLSSLYFSVKNSNMFWTERMRVCVCLGLCVCWCVSACGSCQDWQDVAASVWAVGFLLSTTATLWFAKYTQYIRHIQM